MHKPAAAPAGHTADQFERPFESPTRRAEPVRSEAHASASLAYGVACDVDLGDRSLRVDLPRDEAGTGSAPHPGQLMPASLGARLLMGYRQWSQRLSIALTGAQLELSCEYDARGQLGLAADVPIGWQRLRVHVRLWSDAPEADVMRLVETAHRYSPMLANLSSD